MIGHAIQYESKMYEIGFSSKLLKRGGYGCTTFLPILFNTYCERTSKNI